MQIRLHTPPPSPGSAGAQAQQTTPPALQHKAFARHMPPADPSGATRLQQRTTATPHAPRHAEVRQPPLAVPLPGHVRPPVAARPEERQLLAKTHRLAEDLILRFNGSGDFLYFSPPNEIQHCATSEKGRPYVTLFQMTDNAPTEVVNFRIGSDGQVHLIYTDPATGEAQRGSALRGSRLAHAASLVSEAHKAALR